MGASLLRDLRYGEAGYFWADTYDGNCVVLLGSETEGTNRMETKDANGYEMVREIIRVGQEPDGGFVDYIDTTVALQTKNLSQKINKCSALQNAEHLLCQYSYNFLRSFSISMLLNPIPLK